MNRNWEYTDGQVFGGKRWVTPSALPNLRAAKRELKLNAKLLEQARGAISTSLQKGIGLFSEANVVGFIAPENQHTRPDGVIDALRTALQ